jgi:hypothetical protein
MGNWTRPRPFRHQTIYTHTFCSFRLINKLMTTARNDVESGNHSPHKKITRVIKQQKCILPLRVSSDADRWQTPFIRSFALVLIVCHNVLRPAVRRKYKVHPPINGTKALCWTLASSSVSLPFLHRWYVSLDGWSARRKAAIYTQGNRHTE